MSARRRPVRAGTPYLGYRAGDADTPFGSYFDPEMAPLAPHVVEALHTGPQPMPLFTPLEKAGSLLDGDREPVETGYALGSDGSLCVAVHTSMPEVTPSMWDWWFGWHGDDTRKYKLWHPRAHVFAQWADDPVHHGPRAYVGRTSFVDEYIGSTLTRAAISFVPPSRLGLDEARLADPGEATAICARVGLSNHPLDAGYLLHHVRRTPAGSEMRSRFWIGGRHASPRTRIGALDRPLPSLIGRMAARTDRDAADLLVHCAQEMAHLASFLPRMWEEFARED
ncbi:DAPG hydrolase family protein [Streptomyces sp. NPDC048639]|uniref:DAPG hydrolase family protein n=1 Tax=Streptomyces sp. NPDC048639 TaxID=3365581 RepID=UPI00371030DC